MKAQFIGPLVFGGMNLKCDGMCVLCLCNIDMHKDTFEQFYKIQNQGIQNISLLWFL